MKKLVYTMAMAVVMSLLFASCGSQKVAKASYPAYTSAGNTGTKIVNKVKEDIDECEEQSLNEPDSEFRSYGSAVDEDRDFARQQAVLFAKGALVDRIQSMVVAVAKGYRAKLQVNGKTANEADIKQDVGTMAQSMVNNCRIICSNRYRLSDGTYECCVCISVPAANVEQIAKTAIINEDERQGVEHRAKEFRDSYGAEIATFKQKQKE